MRKLYRLRNLLFRKLLLPKRLKRQLLKLLTGL